MYSQFMRHGQKNIKDQNKVILFESEDKQQRATISNLVRVHVFLCGHSKVEYL